MKAELELSPDEQKLAEVEWLKARDEVVARVRQLLTIGVHKQLTNRLLEPWLFHTNLITSTEWDNFFGLRCNADAQPEIRKIAEMMHVARELSTPRKHDEWHLPLVTDIDFDDLVDDWHKGRLGKGEQLWDVLSKVSVGRCARVSYLTHNGKRDPQADVDLAGQLLTNGHLSPFEHSARPMCRQKDQTRQLDVYVSQIPYDTFCGNFRGWVQRRKTIPGEANFLRRGDNQHTGV